MEIDIGEKDRIFLWAKMNSSKKVLGDDWNKDCDTYFRPFDNRQNLSTYSVRKISDLQEKMNSLWSQDFYMKEIIKTSCVAAFKERGGFSLDYGKDNSESNPLDRENEEIPDYIYVF